MEKFIISGNWRYERAIDVVVCWESFSPKKSVKIEDERIFYVVFQHLSLRRVQVWMSIQSTWCARAAFFFRSSDATMIDHRTAFTQLFIAIVCSTLCSVRPSRDRQKRHGTSSKSLCMSDCGLLERGKLVNIWFSLSSIKCLRLARWCWVFQFQSVHILYRRSSQPSHHEHMLNGLSEKKLSTWKERWNDDLNVCCVLFGKSKSINQQFYFKCNRSQGPKRMARATTELSETIIYFNHIFILRKLFPPKHNCFIFHPSL